MRFGLVLVLAAALKSFAILLRVFFSCFQRQKSTKLDFLYIDWHKSEKTVNQSILVLGLKRLKIDTEWWHDLYKWAVVVWSADDGGEQNPWKYSAISLYWLNFSMILAGSLDFKVQKWLIQALCVENKSVAYFNPK